MKNTLTDLNNYLFEQLERLNDDEMTDEQMERELKKADTIVKVSEKIIQNGELAFKTMQHLDRYGYSASGRVVPAMLETKGDWDGNISVPAGGSRVRKEMGDTAKG